ncbi:MAG: hypothetical protein R2823_04980 [Acidimicrobiia bacterium]
MSLRSIALFGLLAISGFAAGLLISDALMDDPVVTLPEPAQYYPIPQIAVAAEPVADGDPGGVIGPVEVPAPAPLFEESIPVYPTIYEEDGTPVPDLPPSLPGGASSTSTTTTEPATTTTTGAATTTTLTQTGPSPPAAGPAGATVTIARFTDLCASSLTPACPPGVGALVLYGADGPKPPPLAIEIVPDADASVLVGLRCDPGWPSGTEIPVVLFSNRPFSLLHVRLKAADGSELDAVVNTKSEPSEHAAYDTRVKMGKPLHPTLAEGAHTCVTLRTDKKGKPPDRNGPFEVSVLGYTNDDTESKSVRFTGHYTAQRPPVRIFPLDAHRAYVVVPQRANDTVNVWAYDQREAESVGRYDAGCSLPPADTTGALALRRSPLKGPTPVATGTAGYPWDRDYNRQTIWDLELRDATRYTLCVNHLPDDETEEWVIETANDLELDVYGGALRHTKTAVAGTLLVHLLGVPHCFVASPDVRQGDGRTPFPDVTVYGDGTYPWGRGADMCHSAGWRIGPTIELRALFPDGTNKVYGTIAVPTATLKAHCLRDLSQQPPTGQPCEQHLEWRNQNILCGGGFGTPSCKGDLFFSLEVSMWMSDGRTNNRTNPTDWGISYIAHAADPPDTVPLPSG